MSLTFYIGSLIFLSLLSSIYYQKIIETQSKIKVFDPYEILEISHQANDREIKKSFKKLALKYHPDKNLNNIQAKAKFMLITKAYESLTNENSKKNYELYGNPDGPGSMRFSLGLPSNFILDKKNHNKILILFIKHFYLVALYNIHILELYNNPAFLESQQKPPSSFV